MTGQLRLGIDFGTSSTVAVLARPDGRVTPMIFGETPLLPSAVWLEPGGNLLTGRDALHAGRSRPELLEPNPKRRVDEGTVLLGDQEVPVVELIAGVLRRVADEALRIAGSPVDETVVTCPATWGPTRRQVLRDAARAAGLGDVLLLAEPVAAASYFVRVLGNDVPVGSGLVVYDFGAGTFDASVVRRSPEGFTVLAEEGLADAGGLDIDAAIVDHLGATFAAGAPDVWSRLTQPVTPADRRAHRLLWEDVRHAKEILSRASSTTMFVPLLDTDAPLGREQLEHLARPILDRTVDAVRAAARTSRLERGRLVGLFLVGGSSRMPLAATLLHRAFGVAPTAIEQPELVVAEGSLHAPRTALLGPETAEFVPTVAIDSFQVYSAEPTFSPTPSAAVTDPAPTAPTEPLRGQNATEARAEAEPSPTEPVPAPTEPATAPTEPATVTAEPVTVPTEPVTAPTVPATVAVESVESGAEPAGRADPEPTAPGEDATAPTVPAVPVTVIPARAIDVPPKPLSAVPTTAASPAPPRKRPSRVVVLVGVVVLLALVVGGVLYANRGGGAPTVYGSPACGKSLGFMGDLSGTYAPLVTPMRDAAKLAVDQYNGQHAGCTVTLVEYDSQDDPTVAQTTASGIPSEVIGLVGPAFNDEARAAAPILGKAGLPYIVTAAHDNHLGKLSNNDAFHSASPTETEEAEAAAKYLSDTLKQPKVYVVAEADQDSKQIKSAFADSDGIHVTASAEVTDSTDLDDLAGMIARSGAESVFFTGYSTKGAGLLKPLRAAGFQGGFVATDGVFDASGTFPGDAEDQSGSTIVICPCRPASTLESAAEFAQAYSSAYNSDGNYITGVAYDATGMLLKAISNGADTRARVLDTLDKLKYDGVMGSYEFDSDGELVSSAVRFSTYRSADGSLTYDESL